MTRWFLGVVLAGLLAVAGMAAENQAGDLTVVTPANWNQNCGTYYADGVEPRFTRDDQVKRNSGFSLRIEHLGAKTGTALYQTLAPAWEGCTYEARVWVKTREAKASIALRFRDDKGAYVEGPQEGSAVEGDGDWRELRVRAIAPPRTVAVHVFMICRQGESWFDDLTLREKAGPIADNVDVVLLPARGVARVQVKKLPASSAFTVTCARAGDSQVISTTEAVGDSAEFDIRSLPSGDYVLTASLHIDGRVIESTTVPMNKPAQPWLNQRDPTIGRVPPPWTAVRHHAEGDALAVSVWGRRYTFGASGLPDQIETRGAEILAAPIRWRVQVNDQPASPKFVERTIVSDAPDALTTRTVERDGGLTLETTTRIAFDGMIWNDCAITPAPGSRLTRLDLLVPLRAEHARYRQFPGHDPANRADTGANTVTADTPLTRALPNYGFCWLGDEERGLNWFFTVPGQFQLDRPEQAVTIRRVGDAMRLEVCFANRNLQLTEPLRVSFGLQPTPTRPLPDGWRMRGTQRWGGDDWDIPWTSEALSPYGAGFPKPQNPELYRNFLAFFRRHHAKVVPYMVLTWRDRNSPVWKYYREDWAIPGAISNYHTTRPFWFGHYVCSTSGSYRDWLAYMLRRFVADYEVDGLYHDIQEPHLCTNAHHGCAPGRWDTLGMREVNRRVYAMLHETDRPRMKIDHASAVQHDAVLCFADAVVSGEELCSDGIEPDAVPPRMVYDDYFKIPRIADHLIATGVIGGQRGPIPWFLPELRVNYTAGTRGLMALLLPCDVWSLWQGRSDFRITHMLDRAAGEFGLGEPDVQFHGYWRDERPVQVTAIDGAAAPRVSLWNRPGQGTLVVVANHADQQVAARIDVDLARLGLGSRAQVADAEHRLDWHATGGPLRVSIKPRDFRLIWLRPGTALDTVADTPVIDAVDESHIGGATPELADAPQAVAVGELQGDSTTRFAQPVTFTTPVRITAVSLLLGERAKRWDLQTMPQPPDTVNGYTLRDPRMEIIRLAGQEQEVVAPATWITYAECRPQDKTPKYRTYHYDRFVDLEPGTYLVVLSKEAESADSSHRLYWHGREDDAGPNGLQSDGKTWRKSNFRAAVGVYGYRR